MTSNDGSELNVCSCQHLCLLLLFRPMHRKPEIKTNKGAYHIGLRYTEYIDCRHDNIK